jgi:hypothetical protein
VALWISSISYQLQHSSIRGYVSGIATLHRDNGLPSPTDHPVIHRILDGIAREQALTNNKPLRTLPITPTLIDIMATSADMKNHDNQMIFTAMYTATAGLMRVGELTVTDQLERTLLFKHVQRVPNGYRIMLPFSKTDQYGRQSTVLIGDHKTINMLDTYIDNTKKINNSSNNSNTNSNGNNIFFTYTDGSALTRTSLISAVNKHLMNMYLPPHRGYSFRAGGATTLHNNGVDTSTIKSLGRWRSNAVDRYMRPNNEYLLTQSSYMSAPPLPSPPTSTPSTALSP